MKTVPGPFLLWGVLLMAGIPQPAGADLVERVVALVDDTPILYSDLQAQIMIAMQGLGIDPGDSARVEQLRNEILDRAIDQQVLAAEARLQMIIVDESEVLRAVEEALARNRQDSGSDELFMLELERGGLTLEELRARYAEQARQEMLVSRLVQREIGGDANVTPAEVRAYYDEHRGELPQRQAAVHLQHILVRMHPDSVLIRKARELATEVAGRIRSGEIGFADAARRYSDDPNGRQGGDLFRINRGDFASRLGTAFEDAVFALEPQALSPPLESPLGIHLIRIEERDPAGAWTHPSHILFGVPMVQADQARAAERAEALVTRLRAGESFTDLAEQESDDPQTRMLGGDLGWLPDDGLDPVILEAIADLPLGASSDPVAAEGAYHIFRLMGREAAREYTFDEVAEELTEWVRSQKMESRYLEFVEEVKQRHYIERRPWGED